MMLRRIDKVAFSLVNITDFFVSGIGGCAGLCGSDESLIGGADGLRQADLSLRKH